MEHYLSLLQQATRKYWDKSALNTIGGESFTYSQMATLIRKFHLFFDKAGLQKGQHIALWGRNSARWGMSYLAINTYETVVVAGEYDGFCFFEIFCVNVSLAEFVYGRNNTFVGGK